MNSVASTSNLMRWTQQFWLDCYFKFVLPYIHRTTLHGIELDLTQLPPKIRNRLLNIGYEDAERELCHAMLNANDAVIELGGGLGFIGLYCQKKLGIKRYITVEANPDTIQILQRNYELNDKTPTILNFAVGKEAGLAHLNVGGDFWEHHLSVAKTGRTISVPAITVSSLLERIGPGFTTLIIDIEGAERHIDFATLPSCIYKVILEVHHDLLGDEGVKRLFHSLKTASFRTIHCRDNTFGFCRN